MTSEPDHGQGPCQGSVALQKPWSVFMSMVSVTTEGRCPGSGQPLDSMLVFESHAGHVDPGGLCCHLEVRVTSRPRLQSYVWVPGPSVARVCVDVHDCCYQGL